MEKPGTSWWTWRHANCDVNGENIKHKHFKVDDAGTGNQRIVTQGADGKTIRKKKITDFWNY